MLKKKYLNIVAVLAVLTSCFNQPDDGLHNLLSFYPSCPLPWNLHRSYNFTGFWVDKDSNGFSLTGTHQQVVIWPFDMQIESLKNEFYIVSNEAEFPTLTVISVFQIEIERNKNPEIREELHKRMFRSSENSDIPDYIPVKIWLTTEYPNDSYGPMPKTEIPFFTQKETDSSYILTTLLINHANPNEITAGMPIFFVNYRTTDINPEEFEKYGVILLPAAFEGFCSSSNHGTPIPQFPSVGYLRAEINLFKHENGLYTENKVVLQYPTAVDLMNWKDQFNLERIMEEKHEN